MQSPVFYLGRERIPEPGSASDTSFQVFSSPIFGDEEECPAMTCTTSPVFEVCHGLLRVAVAVSHLCWATAAYV